MGNQSSGLAARYAQPEGLADLPSVVYKDTLGGSRLMRSYQCVHDQGGLVVVKVYPKQEGGSELRGYESRLREMRRRLSSTPSPPHALPVARMAQSDGAVFLIRQYLHSSLAQRVGLRPFLTDVERLWLAFQLLEAAAQLEAAGVCHGDIKPQNVLLTSWNWAVLVDHAPYKPVALPADDPALFSLFYDTGPRRLCCIAPERFYDPGRTPPTQITHESDIFSVGATIANLYLEGEPMFDYSELLAYRAGTFDPAPRLARLPVAVRGLVAHMTQLEPARRLTARGYLEGPLGAAAFPAWMRHGALKTLLARVATAGPAALATEVLREWPGVVGFLARDSSGAGARGDDHGGDSGGGNGMGGRPPAPPSGDSEPAAASTADPRPAVAAAAGAAAARPMVPPSAAPASPDAGLLRRTRALADRISRLSLEREEGGGDGEGGAGSGGAADAIAVAPPTPPPTPAWGTSAARPPVSAVASPGDEALSHPGYALLAALLCPASSGAADADRKAELLWALRDAALRCGDDRVRLQRAIPWLVAAADGRSVQVTCAALGALADVLGAVRELASSETRLYAEYVLPSLSKLPRDPNPQVGAAYAMALPAIARSAGAHLDALRNAAGCGPDTARVTPASAATAAGEDMYEAELAAIRAAVGRIASELLGGRQPAATLALAPSLGELAAFLGRADTADVLVPAVLAAISAHEEEARDTAGGGRRHGRRHGPHRVRQHGEHGPPTGATGASPPRTPQPGPASVGASPPPRSVRPSSRLRAAQALLRGLPALLSSLGPDAFAALALPSLEARLRSPDECVRSPALEAARDAVARGLTPPRSLRLLATAAAEGGALRSRRTATRAAALELIRAACRELHPADVAAFVQPALRASLTREPYDAADADALVAAMPRADELALDPLREGTTADGAAAATTATPRRPPSPPTPDVRAVPARSLPLATDALREDEGFLSAAVRQALGGGGEQGAGGAGPADPIPAIPPRLTGAALAARARRGAGPIGARSGDGAGPARGARVARAVRDALLSDLGGGSGDEGFGPDASGLLASTAPPPRWRPRGALAAHYEEHSRAVIALAAGGGGAFFASASADGTVRVWDARRLARDVAFRSRITYGAHSGARVSALACPHGTSLVASGDSRGRVRIWRVERPAGALARAPARVEAERDFDLPGAVTALASRGPSAVLHADLRSGAGLTDLRAPSGHGGAHRPAWTLPFDPRDGAIRALAAGDPHTPGGEHWLATSTSHGILTLWDSRFGVPVASVSVPGGGAASALAPARAPRAALGLPPAPPEARGAPLLYVAAGGEANLWSPAEGRFLQVLRSIEAGAPGEHPEPLALLTSHGPPARSPDAPSMTPPLLALLPTPYGPLLAAGGDRVVRSWDARNPQASYAVVCPSAAGSGVGAGVAPRDGSTGQAGEVPLLPRFSFTRRDVCGISVLEERRWASPPSGPADEALAASGWSDRAASACHAQAITCMLRVGTGEGRGEDEDVLVTASADGVIKAWR